MKNELHKEDVYTCIRPEVKPVTVLGLFVWRGLTEGDFLFGGQKKDKFGFLTLI